MTRVTLVLAFAMAVALLGAARADAARPHFGAEASALGGKLSFSSSTLDYAPHARLGWSAGSTAELALAPHWSLVSGLRFVQIAEREQVTVTSTSKGVTSTIRGTVRTWWSWVGLPALARLRPSPLRWLYVEAGPELRYLTSATMNSEITSTSGSPLGIPAPPRRGPLANIFEDVGTFGSEVDVTDHYERVDVAATAGVGVSREFAGHPVALHVRFGQGLVDLDKGEPKRRSQALELGAGWSF